MSTHEPAPAIEVLHPPDLPAPLGPYSHGVRAGELVFCAGQLALDRASSAPLADLPVREQTAIVLANLAKTLQAAGSSLQRVVRTTVYLVDLDDYDEMNAAYSDAFGPVLPARATFAVKELLGGLRVEIDAVAIVDPTVRT